MFSVILFLYNYIAQRLMKKSFLIISIFSSFILFSGCTYNEIETKANEAGNVIGRLLRGASNGLVEGFSGQEKKSND